MTFIVVVGGSILQFPLIDAARQEGKNVLCIDGDENCFCAKLSDIKFIHCDISDISACINALNEFDIQNAVTAQSDVGVILVEQLKRIANRSDQNLAAAKVFTFKDQFRKYTHQHNLSSVEFAVAQNSEDQLKILEKFSNLTLPIAIKPCDSSGSRGVTKVIDSFQLKPAILNAFKYSKQGVILAESWLMGEEFGAQAFINEKGQCIYLHHYDYLYNNIPVAHFEIPKNSRLEEKIQKIVTELSITNAILNIDAIKTGHDIEIIEIGLRLGATDIYKMVNEKFKSNIFSNIVNSNFNFYSTSESQTLFGILFNPTQIKYRKISIIDSLELNTSKGNIKLSLPDQFTEIVHLDNGTNRYGSFELDLHKQDVDLVALMIEIIQLLKRQEILEEILC